MEPHTESDSCSRTPWQGDPESLARIKTAGKVNDEGYVNVADQLGLSTERGKSFFSSAFSAANFAMSTDSEPRLLELPSLLGKAAVWRLLLNRNRVTAVGAFALALGDLDDIS